MSDTDQTRLPVSVVLPTLNCADVLERHLEYASSHWLPFVEQVIAVDSSSSDGTRELLERYSRDFEHFRVIDGPKGLYTSWNAGIRLVGSPFTYISTVGDLIDGTGLRSLVDLMDAHGVDCVITPPVPVDEKGAVHRGKPWPIHRFINDNRITEPVVLSPERFFIECLHAAVAGGLNALLGSSASNLYRTDLLKKCPFPTDADTKGDTFWGIEHGMNISVLISPESCAQFLVHEKNYTLNSSNEDSLLVRHLEHLARKKISRATIHSTSGSGMNVWLDILIRCRRMEEIYAAWRKRSTVPWYLTARGWYLYGNREWMRRRARGMLRRMRTFYPLTGAGVKQDLIHSSQLNREQ